MWPRPDGWPETSGDYLSASRVLRSWRHHYDLAATQSDLFRSVSVSTKASQLAEPLATHAGPLRRAPGTAPGGQVCHPRLAGRRVRRHRPPGLAPLRERRRPLGPSLPAAPRHRAQLTGGTQAMTDSCGRPSYSSISRRSLLRTGAAAGTAGVVTSMVGDVLTASVFGAEPRGNVLVVVSQRGGVDGLSMVVPHAESASLRRPLDHRGRDVRPLHRDHTFGLHPVRRPRTTVRRRTGSRPSTPSGCRLPTAATSTRWSSVLQDADTGSRQRVGWSTG